MKTWCNLHTHTTFSMLDGYGTTEAYAQRAKELGMPAIAVTDHGNVHSWLDHYDDCKSHGIKPILGIEAYQARKTRFDRDEEERSGPARNEWDQRGPYHLGLIAQNMAGYQNIIRMSSKAYLEGFYVKPRLDMELLSENSEGVIVLSGCLGGAVQQALLRGDFDAALAHASQMQDIVGKDNYFIELQDHDIEEQRRIKGDTLKIAKMIGAKVIATGDCHYVRKEDFFHHDAMLCINTGSRVDDEDRFRFQGDQFFLHSYEEMLSKFEPEWLQNTCDIADMVDVDLSFDEFHFPQFPDVPKEKTPEEFLEEQVWEGLRERYGDPIPDEVQKRAEYEFGVVQRMGFVEYFLVVGDLVRWAKDNDIMVGPGRGSAAGCILSYALRITNLDPIRFGLIFDRFLIEGRKSMPDIDLDFDDRYRDRVIDYAKQKYGEDRVCQIVTFTREMSRSAIKDAARVLAYDYELADKISKAMPPMVLGVSKSIEESLVLSDDLRKIYDNDIDGRKVIDTAIGIEGVYRQTGIHAAGVIITPGPLIDYVPIMLQGKADNRIVTTQWDMNRSEQVGVLKIDCLALRNLGVIDIALKDIKNRHGIDVDIDNLPLDDKKIYDKLSRGETDAVFQLECLSGESMVGGRTIAKLYEQQEQGRPKTKTKSVYLDEGKIHLNNIVKIVKSTTKPLFLLKTESSRFIEASADHKFMTKDGWKSLGDIAVGEDRVLVSPKQGKSWEDMYGVDGAKEMRLKTSARMSGSNNHMFGKFPPHRKGGFRSDLGHYVRSSWEADYARILNYLKEPYKYEFKTFTLIKENGESINYTPDFYLPRLDQYIEIKGFMRPADREKLDLFAEQYPDVYLSVVSSTKFAEFELMFKDLIAWECPVIPDSMEWERVVDIGESRTDITYDIVMEGPGNNYIASGFMVHNSGGMKEMTAAVKPDKIDDLMAILALYRPGPMGSGMDKMYINRRHGREKVSYPHPKLKYILEPSYGIMLYQEDVLRTTRAITGWDAGQADDLRKAIGKKLIEKIGSFRKRFVQDAVSNNVSEELANKIFSDIEYFAGYGFNRAHAISYGVISYITAWLRTYYPSEYMAACLTSTVKKKERLVEYLNYCRKVGINVTSPSIELSESAFRVDENNDIIFGLSAIDGMGDKLIDPLVASRPEGGFVNLYNFMRVVDKHVLNKSSIEKLMRAGALDSLVWFDPDIKVGRDTLLGALEEEKEQIGFYITDHPLSDIWDYIKPEISHEIADLKSHTSSEPVKIGGILSKVVKRTTKRNQTMYVLTMEDLTDSVTVLVFPNMAAKFDTSLFKEGSIGIIGGRIMKETDDQGENTYVKIAFGYFEKIRDSLLNYGRPIMLRSKNTLNFDQMKRIENLIETNPGTSQVLLNMRDGDHWVTLKFKKLVSEEAKDVLEQVVVLSEVYNA